MHIICIYFSYIYIYIYIYIQIYLRNTIVNRVESCKLNNIHMKIG